MKKLMTFITILLLNTHVFSSEPKSNVCDGPDKYVAPENCDISTRPPNGNVYRVYCKSRAICQELPNGEKEVVDTEYYWKKVRINYP